MGGGVGLGTGLGRTGLGGVGLGTGLGGVGLGTGLGGGRRSRLYRRLYYMQYLRQLYNKHRRDYARQYYGVDYDYSGLGGLGGLGGLNYDYGDYGGDYILRKAKDGDDLIDELNPLEDTDRPVDVDIAEK